MQGFPQQDLALQVLPSIGACAIGGSFSPIQGALGLNSPFHLSIALMRQHPIDPPCHHPPALLSPPKHPWVQRAEREGLSTLVVVASPPNALILP